MAGAPPPVSNSRVRANSPTRALCLQSKSKRALCASPAATPYGQVGLDPADADSCLEHRPDPTHCSKPHPLQQHTCTFIISHANTDTHTPAICHLAS